MKFGEILGIVVVGGVGWYLYNAYLDAAASNAITTGTPPANTSTPATGAFAAPAGFTITTDTNGAYKGTVTFNGALVTLDVIPGAIGKTAGVIWNTSGADVTGTYTAAQQTQLYGLFQAAAQAQGLSWPTVGVSGLGAGPRPMLVPRAIMPQRGMSAYMRQNYVTPQSLVDPWNSTRIRIPNGWGPGPNSAYANMRRPA
jgi:hypothetical protein